MVSLLEGVIVFNLWEIGNWQYSYKENLLTFLCYLFSGLTVGILHRLSLKFLYNKDQVR